MSQLFAAMAGVLLAVLFMAIVSYAGTWAFNFYEWWATKPLKAGWIVNKWHTRASSDTTMMPMYIGETIMMIPQETYTPESWDLVIKGFNEDGKEMERTVSVSEEFWKSHKLGDNITITD